MSEYQRNRRALNLPPKPETLARREARANERAIEKFECDIRDARVLGFEPHPAIVACVEREIAKLLL